MERKQYQGIVENSRTWWTYCCLSIFCEPITVRVRSSMRLGFRIEIKRMGLSEFFSNSWIPTDCSKVGYFMPGRRCNKKN